ncbi:SelB C-terminal domain-containing protein, partial [bacterium]|nr:SelB C-terminal domain-containing protein [bacterium]
GQCLALNIPEFGRPLPERGQVLAAPGFLRPANWLHVKISVVSNLDHALQNATPIKLHTGTVEASGKLYLLDAKTLGPGDTGFASISLPEAIGAAPHDRCILRRPSPAMTVAGAEILEVSFSEHRPRRQALLQRLQARDEFLHGIPPRSEEGRDRRVLFSLLWEGPVGGSVQDLSRNVLLPVAEAEESLNRLKADGDVLALGRDGGVWIHRDRLGERISEAEVAVREEASRSKLGLRVSDLQGRFDWPAVLWQHVLADLERRRLVTRRGDRLILSGAVDDMPEEDRRLLDRILALYERTGFQSPRPEELPGQLGALPRKVQALLQHLFSTGELVRVSPAVVLHRGWYDEAESLAVRMIREQGPLESAEFKAALGTSRKYAIAFLEHLDGRKVTIRMGNARQLMPDYEGKSVR